MGRVPPLLLLLVSIFSLTGCEPEPPPPPTASERAEEAVRDAGEAAREAVKKAGEALRKLGQAASAAGEAAGEAVTTEKPADEAAPVEEAVIVAPVPDETERIEQARDASVATQEATDRFLEATRRAAERVKHVGQGMAEAFRHKEAEADAPAPVQDKE